MIKNGIRTIAARTRLAQEEGVALVVASGIILVLGIFSAAVAAGAVELGSSSNKDRNAKRALAFADAGLRQGMYRLNMVAPDDTDCLGAMTVSTKACDAVAANLGNGNSYRYYLSPTLETQADLDNCVGNPVTTSGQTTVEQRCLTAIGRTASGIERRVQFRIAGVRSLPEFNIPGIQGFNCVSFGPSCDANATPQCTIGNQSGNGNVSGDVGSNGQICVSGNQSTCQHAPGDSNPPTFYNGGGGTPTNGGGSCQFDELAQNPAFQPLHLATYFDPTWWDPGGAGSDTDDTKLAANNENDELVDPANGNITGCPTNSTVTVTPDRQLIVPNSCDLRIPGGTYNFCRVYVDQSATITITGTSTVPAPGDPTVLLIDSPYRVNSGCSQLQGGTQEPDTAGQPCPGNVNDTPDCADGSVRVENSNDVGSVPKSFFVRVYGNPCSVSVYQGQTTPPSGGTVALCPSGASQVVCCSVNFRNANGWDININAPFSDVTFENNGNVNGAIIGRTVDFENGGTFSWDDPNSSGPGFPFVRYYPAAWAECSTRSFSDTDPAANC